MTRKRGYTFTTGKAAWNRTRDEWPRRQHNGRYEVQIPNGRWVSRQRANQVRRELRGVCRRCDRPVIQAGCAFCLIHLKQHRVRQRHMRGFNPHEASGRGRPPLEDPT